MIDITVQGPFRTTLPLVLASGSPRRQALLCTLGLHFEVVPSALKEPAPDDGEPPASYARRMACLKGADIAGNYPDNVVLAADTIVVRDDTVLGKPRTREDALTTLLSLAGRDHEVITGICLVHKRAGLALSRSVSTIVTMAEQDRDTLAAYVATAEPMDKAGSYGIQGVGGFLVSTINGSYSNVVGLPVHETLEMLREAGAVRCTDGHE
jgi:septum formation protein